MTPGAAILYCHCAYAKVVPPDVKAAVLNGLSEADVEFDAVPDLCEMAARGDARLRELAADGPLKIAACYPRAVKWLFAAAGAQLPDDRRASGTCGSSRPTPSSTACSSRADAGAAILAIAEPTRHERRDRPAIPGGAARDAGGGMSAADRATLTRLLLERGLESRAGRMRPPAAAGRGGATSWSALRRRPPRTGVRLQRRWMPTAPIAATSAAAIDRTPPTRRGRRKPPGSRGSRSSTTRAAPTACSV